MIRYSKINQILLIGLYMDSDYFVKKIYPNAIFRICLEILREKAELPTTGRAFAYHHKDNI